ncbi:MAG: tetratricopeptide repeat protein, partial [Planctomycetota bacterium]
RRVAQLEPDDPADVHLRLAQALQRLGQTDEAKRHVVKALEEAPRYRAAHRLLLEIVRGASSSGRGSATTQTESVPAVPGVGTIEGNTDTTEAE